MDDQDKNFILFKNFSFKLILIIFVGSLLSLGVYLAIDYIGWPDTVKWFFSAFLWIFMILTGVFHIIEKMQMQNPSK
jgi:hypothetical protein